MNGALDSLRASSPLKVMLHETSRNERFQAQDIVAMLEQCCNHSKQCRNSVVMLCYTKNRRCESSSVTSPLWRTRVSFRVTFRDFSDEELARRSGIRLPVACRRSQHRREYR